MSDLLVWTFGAVTFYPTGKQAVPKPVRDPRVEVFNMVGSGRAEFNTFGYTEYTLEMQVLVLSDSLAAALESLELTEAILSGGGIVKTAFLMNVKLEKMRTDYHEGKVVFKWGANV